MLIWAHNQWVFRHEAIKLNDVDIMHGVAKWRSSWDDLLNSTIFSTHYKAWHKICHLKTFIYILWPNVHSDIFLWVSLTLTYWCQDNVAAILLYENFGIWVKIHLNLFPMVQLTIWLHWFRWWLGADKATSHYVNQWWSNVLTHIICHSAFIIIHGLVMPYGDIDLGQHWFR